MEETVNDEIIHNVIWFLCSLENPLGEKLKYTYESIIFVAFFFAATKDGGP